SVASIVSCLAFLDGDNRSRTLLRCSFPPHRSSAAVHETTPAHSAIFDACGRQDAFIARAPCGPIRRAAYLRAVASSLRPGPGMHFTKGQPIVVYADLFDSRNGKGFTICPGG